jgi:hypothetical protein
MLWEPVSDKEREPLGCIVAQRAEALKDLKPLKLGKNVSQQDASLSARSTEGDTHAQQPLTSTRSSGGVTARSLSRMSCVSIYYDATEELESPEDGEAALPSSAALSYMSLCHAVILRLCIGQIWLHGECLFWMNPLGAAAFHLQACL